MATVREASREDVDEILRLIKCLAKYERLENQVVCNSKLLQETLFDKAQMPITVLLLFDETCEPKGRALGFALYFFNYSTFLGLPGVHIEDLYVDEQHRGKGYGTKLLQKVCQTAVEKGCGRVEWAVLNWNSSAIKFYVETVGAVGLNEWVPYRLAGDALSKFARDGHC